MKSMSTSKLKIAFLLGLTTSLILTGCQHRGPNDPENLLTAEDRAASVDGEVDPVAAHLAARAQVDPHDTRSSHAYTTKPTAQEIDEDTNIRVVRLENQVNDLHNDFKKLMPNLSPSNAEMVEAAPVPAEKPEIVIAKAEPTAPQITIKKADNLPPPEKITPAAGNASSNVTGVRVGVYPERTRLVLDVSAESKFTYDLDNNEKLLIIDLPQAGWTAATEQALAENAVIKGYAAKPAPNGGVTVAVELKKPAKLTMSTALGPNEMYGHRIVFDVAPL